MDGVEQDIGKAVIEAGADPYYFPCRPLKRQEDTFRAVWQVMRRADGVLLPGGATAMVPGWFATAGDPHTGTPAWWEDWWKWHVTQLSTLLCLPFLGVDLGANYLNQVLGGKNFQDMRTECKAFGQHIVRGALDSSSWVWNALEIVEPESRMAQCANGEPMVWGACMHSVAVDKLAPGLIATASSMDQCVEAIERSDAFFGVALQGNPQQPDLYTTQPYTRNLFAMLGEEALIYAASRRDELEDLYGDIRAYLRSGVTPRLTLPAGEGRARRPSGKEDPGSGPTEASRQSTDAIQSV
jgi:gamma-glutamyl-gamma-aminobutyrate hydrolase PuuD